jgi:hypothetical protein
MSPIYHAKGKQKLNSPTCYSLSHIPNCLLTLYQLPATSCCAKKTTTHQSMSPFPSNYFWLNCTPNYCFCPFSCRCKLGAAWLVGRHKDLPHRALDLLCSCILLLHGRIDRRVKRYQVLAHTYAGKKRLHVIQGHLMVASMQKSGNTIKYGRDCMVVEGKASQSGR